MAAQVAAEVEAEAAVVRDAQAAANAEKETMAGAVHVPAEVEAEAAIQFSDERYR